jgi:hypothetical protein
MRPVQARCDPLLHSASPILRFYYVFYRLAGGFPRGNKAARVVFALLAGAWPISPVLSNLFQPIRTELCGLLFILLTVYTYSPSRSIGHLALAIFATY